jgi:hypothetical protein
MDTFKKDIYAMCSVSMVLNELLDPAKALFSGNLKFGYDNGRFFDTEKEEKRSQLEDIVKTKLEQILDTRLPAVILHYGGQNQELLRSVGAFALTQGNDIIIREEMLNPGFAETDAILLHELVHVKQYNENIKLISNEDREKAEREAEQAEKFVYPNNNTNYYAEIDGELFYMNQKILIEALDFASCLLKKYLNELIEKEDIKMLCGIIEELEI